MGKHPYGSIEDIEIEELPQSKTSQKWMRRLKILGSVLVVAVISVAVAIAIGTSDSRLSSDTKKDVLTLKAVVKTLKSQGLSLKKDKLKSPDDFHLNGVKPTIYSVGKNKDTLLVYTFKSLAEREKILMETNKFNNPYSLEAFPYKAKNVLIVFMFSKVPETEEDMNSASNTIRLLSDTIFTYLNNAKERVYKGESESWECTFTLKYYQHEFQDETGTLRSDSYSKEYPVIKYKMSDIDNVGLITFRYQTPHSYSEYTDLTINKDGYINTGGGGIDSIFDESEDITFTIKWGDKEEHIVLKVQQ